MTSVRGSGILKVCSIGCVHLKLSEPGFEASPTSTEKYAVELQDVDSMRWRTRAGQGLYVDIYRYSSRAAS